MKRHQSDVVVTRIKIAAPGQTWIYSGLVKHKRDLSDLGEPYLSAVKCAPKMYVLPGLDLWAAAHA